jgi:hypothetical protein
MSKAEEFIQENTKDCSNASLHVGKYYEWITPHQAKEAVEIAREEIIDKTLDFLKDKLYESGYIGIMDLCDEYIKAMKDEKAR